MFQKANRHARKAIKHARKQDKARNILWKSNKAYYKIRKSKGCIH